MAEAGISPHVRAFVADHVDSVMALETLLLLAADPGRRWTGASLAQHLRIGAGWAAGQLQAFAGSGLAAADALGAEFWYAPRTPELLQTVADLAQTYADRRVTVVSLVFEKPVDPVRRFADSFRIRKDTSDG